MIWLFALQLALTFILVAWIGLAPARSVIGFWIQVIAGFAGLLAVALTGLWLFPPWWSPFVFASLILLAAVAGLRRAAPFASLYPVHIREWGVAAFFVVLGGMAVSQAARALSGCTPPQARLVDLVFPLDGGTYFIVNGGSDPGINAHLMTLDTSVPRFREWRGQSYAVDIVKVGGLGFRANGVRPSEPREYRIYGSSVLAPCAGRIVAAVDGLADMQVPETDRAHMAGNHVIVRCSGADVVLGHFRPERSG